jgi:cell division protein FtsI/penicillin-binding protein 2
MRVQKTHYRRLNIILSVSCLLWILLVAKLVSIQLHHSTVFQRKAAKQQLRRWELEPKRGVVYDRRLTPVTLNLPFDSFGACPEKFIHQNEKISYIASELGLERETVSDLLNRSDSFVWLSRKVEPDVGQKIRTKNLEGIIPVKETFRYYPFGDIGGQVIGYTDLDNYGIEGMELELDSVLTGTPGTCLVEMDASKRRHSNVKLPYHPARNGADVVLTVDMRIQAIVHEELRFTVERHGAKGAMAVVLIPQTGEILAMASYPGFNPNAFDHFEEKQRKNRVVTDTYEPGSIFKIVTAAAALQERAFQPEDSIYAEQGTFPYAGSILHDWKKFGWVTFRQAIEHSVNIAMAKIALKLGPQTFYEYAKGFGFGCKTGLQFPGEVEGVLRNPAKWSKRSLMTLALGQEVAVTPLQMACAFAAVANDGQLVQPQIVRRVINQRGEVIREMEPLLVRRVLRSEIAQELTRFLIGVVDHGTGVKAQVNGISVAGKTGTAQKAERGGYSETKFMASFVGFLPADDPKVVGLVVVDEPRGIHWGGEVAAPAFGRMMRRLIHLPGGPVERYLLAHAERLSDDELVAISPKSGVASEEGAELLSQFLKLNEYE